MMKCEDISCLFSCCWIINYQGHCHTGDTLPRLVYTNSKIKNMICEVLYELNWKRNQCDILSLITLLQWLGR